jgi:hypothetical protein
MDDPAEKDSIRFANLHSKPVEQVALLPGPPPKPFRVIGHVLIKGAPAAKWQKVAEAAREEAADMGADAVFMADAGEYYAGTVIMPGSTTTTTTGSFTGSSFSARSQTYSGPSTAMAMQNKRFTGIAIVYESQK